jgi:hypothetical protein
MQKYSKERKKKLLLRKMTKEISDNGLKKKQEEGNK